MKKQPIDDLFAKKLTHWEPKVSPDLWDRIEAKQEKKTRRLGGWFWSVAASLTLLLTTGYLLWQSQPAVSTGTEVAVVQKETKGFGAVPASIEPIEPAIEARETVPASVSDKTLPTPVEAKQYATVTNPNPASSLRNQTERVATPVREVVEIAAIEREAVETETLVSSAEEPSLSETIEVVAAVVPEATTAPEKRVIRATVDWDEPVQEEARRESRFAKIMQQLKNAKQGEAVDWQEVGFNPKKILARADEKLRNEEDKVSRRYQEFKEKTKL